MDPYLERRDLFPDLHGSLIIFLKEHLQARLPEPYYAASSRRTWVEISERSVEPDVHVVLPRGSLQTGRDFDNAVAVAERAEAVVVRVEHDEWREVYLDIFIGPRRERRLVTSIEVLSPSNKSPGNKGRELYLQKQREVLDSRAHLIEIDLLRDGLHATAVPEDWLRHQVGAFDYHVCSHQFDVPKEFNIYPIRLEQSLPLVKVPLLPGDGSVEVDLQAVFNRAYDAGPYRREIDYEHETPDPPLDEKQMRWARELSVRWRSAAS
jgi:hypothetical protein